MELREPRIDIVDDDELLRALFVAIAEESGFCAKSYDSAESYLSKINNQSESTSPPLLAVITDVRMPGKSGYELIHELKERNPNQKFAIITGTPHDGIDKDARACFYLKKPIDVNRLQTVFRKFQSCTQDLKNCRTEQPLCKSLCDLDDFGIDDWSCPLTSSPT